MIALRESGGACKQGILEWLSDNIGWHLLEPYGCWKTYLIEHPDIDTRDAVQTPAAIVVWSKSLSGGDRAIFK